MNSMIKPGDLVTVGTGWAGFSFWTAPRGGRRVGRLNANCLGLVICTEVGDAFLSGGARWLVAWGDGRAGWIANDLIYRVH